MRIAYLVSQYPAISHTFIRREIAELRRRGHDIVPFTMRPAPVDHVRTPEDAAAREETWAVLPVGPVELLADHARAFVRRPAGYLRTLGLALRHRVPGAKALVWALFHFAEAMHLARELEARDVGHLHNHFANAAANVGLLAARYLGLGWSVTLHGTADFDYPAGPLLPDKLEAADFVACVSHFGRAQALRTIGPGGWDKVFVSRCGVELRDPAPRAARGGPHRFLCVGRLSIEKGHTGLLEAFSQLVGEGLDVELTLIGDGPAQGWIEEYLRANDLGGRVRMPGAKGEREVLEAMDEADAFVLPSLMEGLPVVLMEAMMLRLPVVAPRLSGIPELVEEGVSGCLFTPAVWDDLADAMRRLVHDPELAARLGEAGRAKVCAEFAIERAVEPLLARFDALGHTERTG